MSRSTNSATVAAFASSLAKAYDHKDIDITSEDVKVFLQTQRSSTVREQFLTPIQAKYIALSLQYLLSRDSTTA